MRIAKEEIKNISARAAALNYRELKHKYSAATPADGITQKTLARAIVLAKSEDEELTATIAYSDFIKDLERRTRNNNKLAGSERR